MHFLRGDELDAAGLNALLDRAIELKADPLGSRVLEGRAVALVFERPSTRTRSSFEVGVFEMGGHPMVLRGEELQLTRGEAVGDVARVLSRHAAVIGYRSASDAALAEMAEHSDVPVINMLSPSHHPCQVLADLMTLREALGDLRGRRLAYVGDGKNNMARTLAIMGRIAGLEIAIAAPGGYQLEDGLGAQVFSEPAAAVEGADAVYADVWLSMSDDEWTAAERRRALEPYRLDEALLDQAADGAIALHCLPAHPGEEISAELLYGARQRIWDQAENRRHAQKALLELLVDPLGSLDR